MSVLLFKFNSRLRWPLVFSCLALFALVFTALPSEACRKGRGYQTKMGSCRLNSKLAHAVRVLRIKPTSGCRSRSYNRCIGGHPNSRHMAGNAIDTRHSKRQCYSASLARKFSQAAGVKICPLYHCTRYATGCHCHLSACGTARSHNIARKKMKKTLKQVRTSNRYRAAGQGYGGYGRKIASYTPKRYTKRKRRVRSKNKYWTRERLLKWREKMRRERQEYRRKKNSWSPFRDTY